MMMMMMIMIMIMMMMMMKKMKKMINANDNDNSDSIMVIVTTSHITMMPATIKTTIIATTKVTLLTEDHFDSICSIHALKSGYIPSAD